jgi:hypothetical protein
LSRRYNPPPGWDVPLEDGRPTQGFSPDPNWPEPPEGWQFWIVEEVSQGPTIESSETVLKAQTGSHYDFGPALEDDDRKLLQALGVYTYHHPLETALEYEAAIEEIREEITGHIKSGTAVQVDSKFIFENSVSKGQRLSKDLSLLCLRSFNSEVENAMRTMKAGGLSLAKGRLEKARTVIGKLGDMMGLQISPPYFDLRIRELELVSDYLAKKQEEKERERDERARLREERQAAQELEQERERLERELVKFTNALSKSVEGEDVTLLEAKISEIKEAIEKNDYRLQHIRAGYVYVISNPGAFGERVVKIGMTRRLDPMDRIRELGDASVPFPFEVHLLHFDADAVTLENQLHRFFSDRKLNAVNQRKEFFFASADEVKEAILTRIGATVEFNSNVVAEQYLQSRSSWPSDVLAKD